MRKMIAFIAVLLMITATAFGAIAEYDLSALSLSELLALQDAVKAEITARPENTYSVFAPGFYIVGEDILPGEYFFLYDSGNYSVARIYIYKDKESFEKGYQAYSKSRVLYDMDLCKGGDSQKRALESGNIVAVDDASIKISCADFNDEVKNLSIIPEKAKQIPIGNYVVGTDIAAGKYTAYIPIGSNGSLGIYKDAESYTKDKYNYISKYYLNTDEWNVTFTLENGQLFVVDSGTIYMTKAESKMFTFD